LSGGKRFEEAIKRGKSFQIEVDGHSILAYAGETVAAALLANGFRILRYSDKRNHPRGIFCGIGVCYDCLVTVNGIPNQRACMTPVQPNLVITLQRGHPQGN
jgi:predicted molibdopterin-dependent oxidoreductase YjgC